MLSNQRRLFVQIELVLARSVGRSGWLVDWLIVYIIAYFRLQLHITGLSIILFFLSRDLGGENSPAALTIARVRAVALPLSLSLMWEGWLGFGRLRGCVFSGRFASTSSSRAVDHYRLDFREEIMARCPWVVSWRV
jgi:hypothetical protein